MLPVSTVKTAKLTSLLGETDGGRRGSQAQLSSTLQSNFLLQIKASTLNADADIDGLVPRTTVLTKTDGLVSRTLSKVGSSKIGDTTCPHTSFTPTNLPEVTQFIRSPDRIAHSTGMDSHNTRNGARYRLSQTGKANAEPLGVMGRGALHGSGTGAGMVMARNTSARRPRSSDGSGIRGVGPLLGLPSQPTDRAATSGGMLQRRPLSQFKSEPAQSLIDASNAGSARGPKSRTVVGIGKMGDEWTRTDEEKSHAPDRINLDCQGLERCVNLIGEERLRLLNYQNNQISAITGLHKLRSLVFLDLYNNQIEKIENLDNLVKLRVLMLGKNRISRIENLDSLQSLEVLDLHSNGITEIRGVSHLVELRVLNLAGNHISQVNHLGVNLRVLTEINLRHNRITMASDYVPSLQRLFLSNNQISTLQEVGSLLSGSTLAEVCMDNNPVAAQQLYRPALIEKLPGLRSLDLRRVSTEERRTAQASMRREDDRLANIAQQNKVKGECEAAIEKVSIDWAKRSTTGSRVDSSHGFSMVEGTKLSLYGNTSEELLAAYPQCVQLAMHFITYSSLTRSHMVKASLRNNLTMISLAHNDLNTFSQLWQCSKLMTKVPHVQITNNQVCESALFRPFMIFALPTLGMLNDQVIETAETKRSAELFDPVQKVLNDINPIACAPRQADFHVNRAVAQAHIAALTDEALLVSAKQEAMNKCWPRRVGEEVALLVQQLEDDEESYAENIIQQLRLEERSELY